MSSNKFWNFLQNIFHRFMRIFKKEYKATYSKDIEIDADEIEYGRLSDNNEAVYNIPIYNTSVYNPQIYIPPNYL